MLSGYPFELHRRAAEGHLPDGGGRLGWSVSRSVVFFAVDFCSSFFVFVFLVVVLCVLSGGASFLWVIFVVFLVVFGMYGFDSLLAWL